jgi:hypothetical protein
MSKKRWIIDAPDIPNPLRGKDGKGDSALVHDQADLDRRLAAAKAAGVKVTVREVKD